MSTWSSGELAAIGRGDEIQVAPDRADGSPGPFVIIWSVEVGDELYARSARGPEGGWYRRALASGRGRIRAGGREYEVLYVDASGDADAYHAAIDAAYHAKYDRYGANVVGTVVGDAAHRVTMRITPAS